MSKVDRVKKWHPFWQGLLGIWVLPIIVVLILPGLIWLVGYMVYSAVFDPDGEGR